jgi:hypothetical protein
MFEPANAREEFRIFLNQKGLSEHALSLRDGIEAMFDFYRDMRANGCLLEKEEDMLLFQWGTYDWGEGKHFSVDLTRQLIFHVPTEDELAEDEPAEDETAEDEDFWQLSLTFEFEPIDQLRALGRGNKWCDSLTELDEFRQYVLRSAPFTAGTQYHARRMTLEYGCAG